MMRVPLLFTLLLTLAVAACGPPVVPVQVVRFHELSPATVGKSFAIQAERNQTGNIEFESYANQVAAKLQQLGMTPVSANADYVVRLDYGIGPPQTVVHVAPPPPPPPGFGLHYGWPRRHWGYGVGFGYGYGYGSTYTTTRYERWLEVEMLDGPSMRRGQPNQVFEGRAINDGRSRALPEVMPFLVAALFDGFPGLSGQTLTIAVPVELVTR